MPEPTDPNVRELVDLDVNEVSLVDRPAIKRTFAIVKRHEEPSMKTNKSDAKPEDKGDEKPAAKDSEAKADTAKAGSSEAVALCKKALEAAASADPDNADAYKWGAEYLAGSVEMEAEKKKAAEKAAEDSEADKKVREAAAKMSKADLDAAVEAHKGLGTLLQTIGALKADETDDEKAAESEKKKNDAFASAIASALAPVVKGLEAVAARVETVEKTRGAARGEGDGEREGVEKKAESIFGSLFT